MDPTFEVPEGLGRLSRFGEGRAWLDALPDLITEAAGRWSLQLGEPFPCAHASVAIPARTQNGADVVLKVAFPHRESEHEADALRMWDGNGAVRLLEVAEDLGASILERCLPGTPLSDVDADTAIGVLVGLIPRLWLPAGPPFRPLAEEAAWWAGHLEDTWQRAGRPFDAGLLRFALDALDVLPRTQGPLVLVNQDLHAGNVLRAGREPWLVIDPKPLAGEREFGIAAIVRGRELGHGPDLVGARLDRLCHELALDEERARSWVIAQTIAWAFDGERVLSSHVDVARWLASGRARRRVRHPRAEPHSSPEATALVEAVRNGVHAALGADMVTLILHGSLATGSYLAGTSDVDILLVTRQLTAGQRGTLLTAAEDAVAIGVPFDLRVVRAEVAANPPDVPEVELSVAYHPRHAEAPDVSGPLPEPDLIVELDACRDHGTVLAGAAAEEVIGPVAPTRVLAVGAQYLRRWLTIPFDESSADFMVFTACRIWHYAARGRHASKITAAAWALGQDPSLGAIRVAIRRRVARTGGPQSEAEVRAVLARALAATEEPPRGAASPSDGDRHRHGD